MKGVEAKGGREERTKGGQEGGRRHASVGAVPIEGEGGGDDGVGEGGVPRNLV